MPGSKDGKRQGKTASQRKESLISQAKADANVRTWGEFFAQKIVAKPTLYGTGRTIALFAVGKAGMMAVNTLTAGWGSTVLGGIVSGANSLSTYGEVAVNTAVDFGSAVIEDWWKEKGEQVVQDTVSMVSSTPPPPQTTEEYHGSLVEDTKDLCEAVGLLAALLMESDKRVKSAPTYCDDVYAEVRILKRIKDLRTSIKTKSDELKSKMDSLQSHLVGLESKLDLRKGEVETRVLDAVQSSQLPHFKDDDWGTGTGVLGMGSKLWHNTTYRANHCSKGNCYGPA